MLPRLVQAVHAQTRSVGRIVGVDTGSRDRSGAVLADLLGQDAVFGMDRATGFGQAVWGALRRVPARRLDDAGQPQVEWIWLLHDDCEPAPETLERLLLAASRDRSVAVLGPKVLDGADRRVLREAGFAIDRAGRRVTGIDPGEVDQGQHDHNRLVMAVGSAGMLIRRDAWEQLGGFDSYLRLFRDDLDFCWRAHSAGYRVQVVTSALLYHRELTARRGRAPEGTTARRLDRRNALYVLTVNLPLLAMLRIVAGCVIGTLLRAAYFLLTKQFTHAADQVYGLSGIFGSPRRTWRARRRRAAGRRHGYSAVRMFIPRARPLRTLTENILSLLSPQGTGGMHHASQAGEGDEDDQFVEPQSVARRIVANHGVQLFAVLLVIALVAQRRLLGTSPLGGGALVPAWGGAPALWREYLAGFHAVGLGSAATAPAYVVVVAALATVLGGQPWLAVDVLLLGCVPLAGLTAYLASRRLVVAPAARVWLAAAYALIPVAAGAVAAGRLGTAVMLILAPLIARAAAGMLTSPPRAARSAAWATGLLVALAAAFVPLVWALAASLALIMVGIGLLLPGRPWAPRLSAVNALVVVAVPFAILFPWSLRLVTSPSGFLLEAGLARDGLASAGLHAQSLLLLSPGGPGLPPVWVTAGFGLAIFSSLLRRRVALVVTGWTVAAAGYAAALAMSRSTVPSTVSGGTTPAWPGTALVIAAAGLLIAAAPAAEWLASGLRAGPADAAGRQAAEVAAGKAPAAAASEPGADKAGPPRLVAVAALVAVASAPVLAAWFWMADGVRGPVAPVATQLLPPFVAAASNGGPSYRTLVLREDGGVLDFSVLRQGDPTLGEPELAGYAPAEQALARQVAALAVPNGAGGGDPGQSLGDFGIRWVLLPSPVNAELAQRLDATVGLVPVNSSPAYDVWQVTGPVARVRVTGPGSTVTTLPSQAVGMSAVSAPAGGGTLVLAEPYGGWTATLNGHPLTSLARPVDGWEQGFTLPAGGGHLAISRDNTARDLSLVAEVIAFLVACVLALPSKGADAQEAASAPDLVEALRSRRAGRAGGRPPAHDASAKPASPARTPAGGTRRISSAQPVAASAVAPETAVLTAEAGADPSAPPTHRVPGAPRPAGQGSGSRSGWTISPTGGRGSGSGTGPRRARDGGSDDDWPSGPGTGPSRAWRAGSDGDRPAGSGTGPRRARDGSPDDDWPSGPGTGPSRAWRAGSDGDRPAGSGTGPRRARDGGSDADRSPGSGTGPRRAWDGGSDADWPTGPGTGPRRAWDGGSGDDRSVGRGTGPRRARDGGPDSDRPAGPGTAWSAGSGGDWPIGPGTGPRRAWDGDSGDDRPTRSGTGPRRAWDGGPDADRPAGPGTGPSRAWRAGSGDDRPTRPGTGPSRAWDGGRSDADGPTRADTASGPARRSERERASTWRESRAGPPEREPRRGPGGTEGPLPAQPDGVTGTEAGVGGSKEGGAPLGNAAPLGNRGRGRHGRPARRIWERPAKDKGGDS